MKEKTSDGQIIIVLTEHPVLGILLIPYIAERLSDNTLQLVEQAFHASAEAMNRMSEAERQAIDIASHYTEKYLMGVYSREKTVSRFGSGTMPMEPMSCRVSFSVIAQISS